MSTPGTFPPPIAGRQGAQADPRVKVIYLAWMFLMVTLLSHPVALAALFAVALGSIATSGLALSAVVRAGRIGWFVAGVSVVSWLFFLRGQGPIVLGLGPVQITEAGLVNGLAVGARIAAILVAFLVVFMSTSTRDIMTALYRMRVSVPFAMVVGITLRLIPQLQSEHAVIIEAQRSRAVEFESGGLVTRLRKHTSYIIPLVLRALKITSDLSLAMEARAFDPYARRTFARELRFGPADLGWLTVMALVFFGAALARLAGLGGMPARWAAGG